jgi:hypothetical protein
MSDNYRDELIQVAAVAVAAVTCLDQGTSDPFTDPEVGIAVWNRVHRGVMNDVHLERVRQEEMWGPQKHDPFVWLAILLEEAGEVARAALHDRFPDEEATARRRR